MHELALWSLPLLGAPLLALREWVARREAPGVLVRYTRQGDRLVPEPVEVRPVPQAPPAEAPVEAPPA